MSPAQAAAAFAPRTRSAPLPHHAPHPPIRPRPRPAPPRARPLPPAPRRAPSVPARALHWALRLPDGRLLDRLMRGRFWIGLIAVALILLVSMQVSLLKMNSGIGRDIEAASTLARENSDLRAERSQLTAGDRIISEAERLGYVMPQPDAVHYLHARGGGAAAAGAARDIAPPSSSFELSLQTEAAAMAAAGATTTETQEATGAADATTPADGAATGGAQAGATAGTAPATTPTATEPSGASTTTTTTTPTATPGGTTTTTTTDGAAASATGGAAPPPDAGATGAPTTSTSP